MRKHLDNDFEKMLKDIGAKRETTLYVGDTTVDIELAKRNLVKCAAVVDTRYCYQDPKKVRSHFPQADFYLNDISALIPLLKNHR
jgi:phosphoglycolate phosphatase-like HAD superfamily hydrolase